MREGAIEWVVDLLSGVYGFHVYYCFVYSPAYSFKDFPAPLS